LPAPSFAQERRIRLAGEASSPMASLAKTVPVLCELPGEADADLLSYALRGVVRRHPALWHQFATVADEIRLEPVPAQIAGLELEVTGDAGGHPDDPPLQQARTRVNAAFDVLGWPLLRAGLISGHRRVLYLSADHLVMDGGSALLVMRELERQYRALKDGREADLPPPGDFLAHSAAERRRYVPGAGVDAEIGEFRALLGSRPAEPAFPIESSWDLARGRYVSFDLLDAGQMGQLTELCRAWRVTPFMAVLAAYGIAAGQLTGAAEAGTLVAVHNRDEPSARAGVGWYANMLPLYFPVGPSDDFAAAAREVRNRLMTLLPYHELPLALVQGTVPGPGPLTSFMSYVDARDDELAGGWRQIDFPPAHRAGHGIWVVQRRTGLRAHVACPQPVSGTEMVTRFEERIAEVLRGAVRASPGPPPRPDSGRTLSR
jgi:Condensation domain